jgi:hypothetical protein
MAAANNGTTYPRTYHQVPLRDEHYFNYSLWPSLIVVGGLVLLFVYFRKKRPKENDGSAR